MKKLRKGMVGQMKYIILSVALLAQPNIALAEDNEPSGLSLMGRGAKDFFDGMKQEMAPAIEGLSDLGSKVSPALRNFTAQMGPAFTELLNDVEDWSVYEPPQRMPNGDILIKRKPELPAQEAPPVLLLEEVPQVDL